MYSSKSIFWYKNQAFLTLKWNFMRQNMLKNVVKREAEGIYLGVWVSKHIYSDTCIFLSCSTQWSGSFETKFMIFGHYGQFLQFYSLWNINALQFGTTITQKSRFWEFLLGNCVFIHSDVVFPYCNHWNLSFGTKIKPLWHCNGILWGKICLKIWLKGRLRYLFGGLGIKTHL